MMVALYSQENLSSQRAILLRFDNDAITTKDDYYTNGLYIGYTKASSTFDESIFSNFIGKGLAHLPGMKKDIINSGFYLAHRMFTPHDIGDPNLIEDDMPYSGQFTLSFSASAQNRKHLDAWTLSIGVTGPITRAEELQFDAHYAFLGPDAEGWDHQIDNEALLNIFYEHRYRVLELGDKNKFFDSLLIGSGGIGNLSSFAELGLGIRIGWNIPSDFYSPTTIYGNPMIGVLSSEANNNKLSFYIFGNISASYVVNNIALDGNTFRDDGHHINYDHLGTRFNYGFALGYWKINLIFNTAFEPLAWENSIGIQEDIYSQLTLLFVF